MSVLLRRILGILLGVSFCISAFTKLLSIDEFELYIYSFGFIGFDLSTFLARIIVTFEFVLGVCLVCNWCHTLMKWTTLVALLSFSSFLLWRIFVNDTTNCHCFGDIVDLNPKESMVKNFVFLILLVMSWKDVCVSNTPKKYIVILSLSIILSVFIYSPPNIFYVNESTTETVNTKLLSDMVLENNLDKGKHVICFYSTGCKHCKRCASKISGIINRLDSPVSYFHVFFMNTGEMEKKIKNFYEENSPGLEISYDVIHPKVFLPIVSGAMPTIVFVDDGKFVREYDYFSISEYVIKEFLMK